MAKIHIAKAGKYLGYQRGDSPFELTNEMFSEMISNFKGDSPVYRGHADVQANLTGEEPKPCGFIKELSVDKDGLHAEVDFFEDMQEEVKEGRWKSSSILADLNAVDGESGKEIGAKLQSLAITNQPFIQGLKGIELSENKVSKSTTIYLSSTLEEKTPEQIAENLQRGKTMEPDKEQEKEIKEEEQAKDDLVLEDKPTDESTEEEVVESEEEVEVKASEEEQETKPEEQEKESTEEVKASVVEDIQKAMFPDLPVEEVIEILKGAMKEHLEKPSEEVEAKMTIQASSIKVLSNQLVELRSENKKLKEQVEETTKSVKLNLINDALKAGKIIPSQRESLLKLSATDLKSHLDICPAIFGNQLFQRSEKDSEQTVILSEREQKAINAARDLKKKIR